MFKYFFAFHAHHQLGINRKTTHLDVFAVTIQSFYSFAKTQLKVLIIII